MPTGLACPACGAPTRVVDSRALPEGGRRRRRECTWCYRRCTTHEQVIDVVPIRRTVAAVRAEFVALFP